jgi:beta-lactam-binding protein with PASTA domain
MFIRSKYFFVHFFLASLTLFFVLWMVYLWLDRYTLHGEAITVPELRGMTVKEMEPFLERKKLRYLVVDSSVYDSKKPGGAVVDQDPSPGSRVKEDRIIYISVNPSVPPLVRIPNLIDATYTEAEAVFQSFGLVAGKSIPMPDIAKNVVLALRWRGRDLMPGDLVPKGSVIDIVVGSGLGTEKVPVPDLVGRSLEDALALLKQSILNSGSILPADNAEIKDSLSAIIVRQSPAYSPDLFLNQGETVDLWIAPPKGKLKID